MIGILSISGGLKAQLMKMVDPGATRETIALYYNLKDRAGKGIMFGHQDALAYGLNENGSRWIDEDNRSDVKSISGSHPAVFGWDLGKIELGSIRNLDGVYFHRMKFWIENAYDRGSISTISWHAYNPEGGNSWTDGSTAIPKILPGGELHENFKGWLDKIADFANNLVGSDGQAVPVIFRPFHEHTGHWFWWGSSSCTPDQFKELWQFTVEYLRDEAGVHNFIYCISPDVVSTKEKYLERYPGDDYVDILGLDDYWHVAPISDPQAIVNQVRIPVNLAIERDKVAALTETGYENIPQEDWWTVLFNALKSDTTASKISWFLVWRNFQTTHHFAPYPGHHTVTDFIEMYDDTLSIFADDMVDMYKMPDIVLSAEVAPLISEFKMFPNPVNLGESVRFRVSSQTDFSIEIQSIHGQVLKRIISIAGEEMIDYNTMQELSTGMYMVRFVNGPVDNTYKLLIQ